MWAKKIMIFMKSKVNSYIELLEKLGVKNIQVRKDGDELSGSCPFPENHKNEDVHKSFSYCISKDMANCFNCGGMSLKFIALKKFGREGLRLLKDYKQAVTEGFSDLINTIDSIDEEVILTKIKTKSKVDSKILNTYPALKKYRGMSFIYKKFRVKYDSRLRQIVFPVLDFGGTLVGYIFRYVDEKSYYKSKDFPCSQYFYGSHLFKPKDTIIIVEGCMDVIRLYDYGYESVLGIMKSKLSLFQCQILREIAGDSKIVLMLDNDNAGRIGVMNALKQIGDLELYGVEYPKNRKDPDELTKREAKKMLKNKKYLL